VEKVYKTAKQIRLDTRQVKAALDGTMTEIRVPIKPQPIYHPEWGTMGFEWKHAAFTSGEFKKGMLRFAPYQVGDVLYVRETIWEAGYWSRSYPDDDEYSTWNGGKRYHYESDGEPPNEPNRHFPTGLRNGVYSAADPNRVWRKFPSIHMPKEAARIFLRVADIRVERVQDITREDAIAEGIPEYISQLKLNHSEEEADIWRNRTTVENFAALWDIKHKRRGYSWDLNPWVRVTKFERLDA
jgi:hypothetical protein